ncbi:hypothetical protein N9M74_02290 [Pontimonas sp.]|nr:hypothetical protein [Pontimonas sp.]
MKARAWLTPIGKALGSEKVETSALWGEFGPVNPDIPTKVGFSRLFKIARDEDLVSLASRSVPESSRDFIRRQCDVLLAVSSSFDNVTPGLASSLHETLELSRECSVLSLNDACTGFVKSLNIAVSMVASGLATNVLVVLADAYSAFYLEENIAVSTLFSDGASSFLVSASRPVDFPAAEPIKFEAVSNSSATAGHLRSILEISKAAGPTAEFSSLKMSGGAVYGFVVAQASTVVSNLAEKAGLKEEEKIRWYVHQGSALVVEAASKTLGQDPGNLFRAKEYGNVVSSSIPFSLFEDWRDIEKGSMVGFLAFGVGMAVEGAIYECISK